MRVIRTHKSHEGDRQPILYAMGNAGVGGAEQNYRISYSAMTGTGAAYEVEAALDFVSLDHEGVTNEALLAVVIDRLEGFQAGPFNCQENADALVAAQAALQALHGRTLARIARGVESQAKP